LVNRDGSMAREWFNSLNRALGPPELPQVLMNRSATTDIGDAGTHWYHNDGNPYTWTIAPNSSVRYPNGSEIEFICNASASIILTTTDTLVWLPSGGTGARTLGNYARARAIKVDNTTWLLDGVGIT